MEQSKKKNKPREKSKPDQNDQDELDSFIEKRKIQNEALKKIVGMNAASLDEKAKKRKDK